MTLVADEPDPGSNHVGSPRWSHDGKRILFDSMPGTEYQQLHMKVIDIGESGPKVTDLGLGACPTWSPDDKRIAFLLNPNAVPGAETGIWVMEADGSLRRRAGDYGIPLWSPDGSQFLIVSFGDPRQAKLINIETGALREIAVPDHKIFSWPSWADQGTLAAVIGTEETGDSVALLDLGEAERPRVKQVLWKQNQQLDVKPMWPVYSPRTHRCLFVGAGPSGMALYQVDHNQPAPARRVEQAGLDERIAGLSFSPDGRYLLFCSTRSVAGKK